MLAAACQRRRRSRMHCDCAVQWGASAVISSLQRARCESAESGCLCADAGGGARSKRGLLVVAGAAIKERNCADHARSTTTVRVCVRARKNADALFATKR